MTEEQTSTYEPWKFLRKMIKNALDNAGNQNCDTGFKTDVLIGHIEENFVSKEAVWEIQREAEHCVRMECEFAEIESNVIRCILSQIRKAFTTNKK